MVKFEYIMKNCSTKLFTLTLVVTLGLFIAGFLVPPTGYIDPSVLTAGGILSVFGLFAQLPNILDSSKRTKISHGNTSIEIENHDN